MFVLALGVSLAWAETPEEASATDAETAGRLTDLFYQLQLLRQETQELRGIVEEQAYRIEQLTRESQRQYRDLDRRLASRPAPAAPSAAPSANPQLSAPSVGAGAGNSERGAYAAAFALMKEQKFAESRAAFDELVSTYPNGKYTPNAFYWLGELHLAQSDPEKARQSFAQVVNLYPDHAKAADALYKLGVVYHRLGDSARSLDYLQQVQSRFPDSSAATLAAQYAQDVQ